MALFVKMVQKGGDGTKQVQIARDRYGEYHVKHDTDYRISMLGLGIKLVGLILALPGYIWAMFALCRLVLLDVYNRCQGTGWIHVFWSVIVMYAIGNVLVFIGAVIYKLHKEVDPTICVEDC